MTVETLLCKMKFICDKQWADLSKIEGEPKIRYCSGCDKNVYWCSDCYEVDVYASTGRCVAFVVEKSTPENYESKFIGYVGESSGASASYLKTTDADSEDNFSDFDR